MQVFLSKQELLEPVQEFALVPVQTFSVLGPPQVFDSLLEQLLGSLSVQATMFGASGVQRGTGSTGS